MKKKILVTGGAGFIGSHLCERLSKNLENEVYSLDNYFTGSINNHVSNVIYIKGDTNDINKLITFCPHIVYHLGEYSRVEQSFDDIQKVWKYNKDGLLNLGMVGLAGMLVHMHGQKLAIQNWLRIMVIGIIFHML